MRLHELREQRSNKVAEMRGLVNKAETEKRDLSTDETARFNTLKGEAEGLEIRIGQAETLADLERRADAEPITPQGGRADLEMRFSLGKALSEYADTGKLTGVEAEYAAEHRSRRPGSIAVPASILLGGEHRAVTTTTPSGSPAGNLVATNLGPLIDRPRPTLAVQRLGATVLSGLTGNLELPRLKSSGSVGWVGEHQEGPQADPGFDKVAMSPKTVTGNYEISRRMLLQAPQIEQVLRADLGFLLAQALDTAATMGTGTGNAPRGIKATPGVRKVSPTYTDANAPTINELDLTFGSMVSLVDTADITGAAGFLGHPKVRSTLYTYRDASGELVGPEGFLQGKPAEWSTQLPAAGGVGTNMATIFYGHWADLLIGYWSSVDIVLNPYADSVAKKGGAYLHAFLDADIAVRHVESFVFTDNFPTKSAAFTTVS